MTNAEQYCLSQYRDQGYLDEKKNVLLKRSLQTGAICVEKHVSPDCTPVYQFLREHPSPAVPEIYECIRTEDSLLILEEYINGTTLEQILENREIFPEEAVRILLCLCDALHTLHQADPPIICRDLKTENIMLDKQGRVVIIDFDIARIYEPEKNRDTRLLGTREYAAPEQFGFGQTDARTDIYALGVLLNYMLLRAFPADNLAPEPYAAIIQKCIRMDPDQRYQTVDELAYDLRRISAAGRSSSGKTPGTAEKDAIHKRSFLPPGFRTRRPGNMILASVVYVSLTLVMFNLDITDGTTGEPLPMGWQRFEQAVLFFSQLLFLAVLCDYRGLRQKLPLVKNRKLPIRILGSVLAELILFSMAVLLLVLLESFFL